MGKIGKYSVDIEINGAAVEVIPSNISFVLGDSINSFYSKATLTINDLEGYGLESRIFTSGSKITFVFGYEENIIKTSFIVDFTETLDPIKSGQLSGKLVIYLIHESFALSERKSESLSNKPSGDIEALFNYSFEDTDIEETKELTFDRLYRPFMNEKETIEKILLPNSISSNSSPSAYFCFIDIKGKLTYKSFSGMVALEPSYSLIQNLTDDLENYYLKIYSILPFTEKLESVKDHIVYDLSYFDNKSLELISEEVEIANVALGGYPIFKTEISSNPYFMNIENFDYLDRDKAHIYNLQKDSLLPDKLIVSTPLFLNYTSGKTVTIKTKYGKNDVSYSYSKKYLIEKASHLWNGKNNQGSTQLILSKPFPEFPANSTIEKGVY